MNRNRNYWVYSAGLAATWAVVLVLTRAIRGEAAAKEARLVFGGYFLGWVSTTIARFVYPPPKKWTSGRG